MKNFSCRLQRLDIALRAAHGHFHPSLIQARCVQRLKQTPTAGPHSKIHQRSGVSAKMETTSSGGESYIEALQAAAKIIRLKNKER